MHHKTTSLQIHPDRHPVKSKPQVWCERSVCFFLGPVILSFSFRGDCGGSWWVITIIESPKWVELIQPTNYSKPWTGKPHETWRVWSHKDMGYNRYNPSKCRNLGGPLLNSMSQWSHQVSTWNSSGWAVSQDPPYAIHIGRGGGELTDLGVWEDDGLGGGFKYFVFSSLFGEMIQFDVSIFFKWVASTSNQMMVVNRLVRPYFFVNCGGGRQGGTLEFPGWVSEFHVTLLGWWVNHLFLSSPSQNHGSVKWGSFGD